MGRRIARFRMVCNGEQAERIKRVRQPGVVAPMVFFFAPEGPSPIAGGG